MIVLTTKMMGDILPLLTASTGPLHTPVLGLFQQNLIPGYGDLIARYTATGALPTYTGYATIVPTFASVYSDSDGSVNLTTTLCVFASPGDNTGNTIYGYYLSDGTYLLGAEVFTSPFVQTTTPQSLVFVASLTIRPGNNNGQVDMISY